MGTMVRTGTAAMAALGASVLALVAVGCGGPEKPLTSAATQRELARIDAGAPLGSTAQTSSTPLAVIYGQDGGVARRARYTSFTITEFKGRSSEEMGRLLEPAQMPVEACHRSDGGKLVVRAKSEKGKLTVDAEPGASLDPAEKRCILEALQATQIDEASTVNAGPSTKPTGFTSLITLEW